MARTSEIGPLKICVIVIGTLLMFGLAWLYSGEVHTPMLRSLCASSCAAIHSDATILRGERSRAAAKMADVEDCVCQRAPESGQTFAGYFLTSIAPLDWIAIYLLRLIPMLAIAALCVLGMAKIVRRM